MAEPSDKKTPDVRSDLLKLDFGKNVFRIEERKGPSESAERKLPPVPVPVPPETSVPPSEILNRESDRTKK